jgi:DNA-directed RNA polymerase specialized sigma24 family protein
MSDSNRIDHIETLWSVVRKAHGKSKTEAVEARQALVDRYGGAVRRYLLKALRDQDAMDEVYQKFQCKFMNGDFHNAKPGKWQFRGFLKKVLSNLIIDYHKEVKRNRMVVRLPDAIEDNEEPASFDDEQFTRCWRDELLDMTWKALQKREAQSGQALYTALRSKSNHPELQSPELAKLVSELLQREITAVNLRKMLSRARGEFANLLLDLVEQSLVDATREKLEEELLNLEIHKYVVHALARRV